MFFPSDNGLSLSPGILHPKPWDVYPKAWDIKNDVGNRDFSRTETTTVTGIIRKQILAFW